jgi:hypothetical protein
MKTRSIKELLIILRDNLEYCLKNNEYDGGMCAAIISINDLSPEETDILKAYLDANKPRNATRRAKKYADIDHFNIIARNSKYTNNKVEFILGQHWWTPKALAPRIKWLNEQINKL